MNRYKSFGELWKEVEADEAFEAEKNILEFTTKLYQLMKERNISKKELARRLNTSQAYITKVFRGNANFTIHTMTKLAKALDGKLHIQITPVEHQVDRWFKVIDCAKDGQHAVPEWGGKIKVENIPISKPEKLQEVA